MITQDEALQLFEYKDGEIYWRVDRGWNKTTGKVAGGKSISSGYRMCSINNKPEIVHRIIFIMHNGYLPEEIDHIDGNPLNNRIENLREANRKTNGQNRKMQINNTSGAKGVSWHKAAGKWNVRVKDNNKRRSFGLFDDFELAELVAIEARNKLHGKFANHGIKK